LGKSILAKWGGIKEQSKLLWKNSSPASAFGAQTITINGINDYDIIFIEAGDHTSNYTNSGWVSVVPAVWPFFTIVDNLRADANEDRTRTGEVRTNAIYFSQAWIRGSVDNAGCIPLSIYGYKIIPTPNFSNIIQLF